MREQRKRRYRPNAGLPDLHEGSYAKREEVLQIFFSELKRQGWFIDRLALVGQVPIQVVPSKLVFLVTFQVNVSNDTVLFNVSCDTRHFLNVPGRRFLVHMRKRFRENGITLHWKRPRHVNLEWVFHSPALRKNRRPRSILADLDEQIQNAIELVSLCTHALKACDRHDRRDRKTGKRLHLPESTDPRLLTSWVSHGSDGITLH